MCRRTGALGILTALAATVPSAHPAHAQDLNCRDFTYQEEAQALFNLARSDPNGLDEEQGPDDDSACEALPRRGDPVTSSTSSPRPAPTTATPVAPRDAHGPRADTSGSHRSRRSCLGRAHAGVWRAGWAARRPPGRATGRSESAWRSRRVPPRRPATW